MTDNAVNSKDLQTSKKGKKKDERTRNWSFFVYPESAPEKWRDVLDELNIEWIESPLHDKDTNEDGEIKKAHWHIVLMFDGNKSYEQIKAITDNLNSPIPQKVASVRGMVRYMLHLDNPEKFQYSRTQIIGHGGADVMFYLKPTSSSRYELISGMRVWVRDNDCYEFCDLFDYAAEERFDDWFPLLCDNSAYIMGEFIRSVRNKTKETIAELKEKKWLQEVEDFKKQDAELERARIEREQKGKTNG